MRRITGLVQRVSRWLSRTRVKRLGQLRLLRPLAAKVGRIARGKDFTTKVRGVKLTMPGYVDYYTDRFERPTLDWLSTNLQPGLLVADVGAHIGFLTIFIARLVGETGRVYAFEPAPDNLSYLRRNVAQNAAANVVVVPAAAGARRATRILYLVEEGDMHSLFPDNPLSHAVGTVEVEQLAMDDVVSHLDLAKIDVEGAEIEVLHGMGRILAQQPKPVLVVEWSPTCQLTAGHEPKELIQVLRDFGYEPLILGEPAGGGTSVDDLMRELHAGSVPSNWYANLLCMPPGRG
jgi:FkbM family methyltransferase